MVFVASVIGKVLLVVLVGSGMDAQRAIGIIPGLSLANLFFRKDLGLFAK